MSILLREERAFWVGKSSLQCWKKLALQSALNNLEGVNVGSDDGVNKSPNRCNAGDERSSQQGNKLYKMTLLCVSAIDV